MTERLESQTEASPPSDRVAPALDDYRMTPPSATTDVELTRAENDRYMTRLGFPSASSVMDSSSTAPKTDGKEPSDGKKEPAEGSTDAAGDKRKAGEPGGLDHACVARHEALGPMPHRLVVDAAGGDGTNSTLRLSAWATDNGDAPGERTLVTAAHGFVKPSGLNALPTESHNLLDYQFREMDKDKDGTLSRKELTETLSNHETNADMGAEIPTEPMSQLKYALENYDAIHKTSMRLDPKATGITNEGLAQHYIENAKARIETPCGDIPVSVTAGDRDKDVVVMKATGLSAEHQRLLGPSYTLADKRPEIGTMVKAAGIPQDETTPTDSTGRFLGRSATHLIPDMGQLDATEAKTRSGMSGGPVTSMLDGKVVGLVHGEGFVGRNPSRPLIVNTPVIKEMLERGRVGRN